MNNLEKWTRPKYYMGEEWPEYFVFLGRNRDSDALTRSNFNSALREIGGESETVLVVRESHFLVGSVEWIAIHESDSKALSLASQIKDRMEDYPVVDEDDWSTEEFNEACESWEHMAVSDRVELLQKHNLNIFAARRSDLPQGLPYFDELISH